MSDHETPLDDGLNELVTRLTTAVRRRLESSGDSEDVRTILKETLGGNVHLITLPVCPTCGGEGRVPGRTPHGNEIWCPCPENNGQCDGHVTMERLVALWRVVHEAEMPKNDKIDAIRNVVLDSLRRVGGAR